MILGLMLLGYFTITFGIAAVGLLCYLPQTDDVVPMIIAAVVVGIFAVICGRAFVLNLRKYRALKEPEEDLASECKDDEIYRGPIGFWGFLRLLHLKFWMVITFLLVFASVVVVFDPEIDLIVPIVVLLISLPSFVLLLKRHSYLKRYFRSSQYANDKEEKRQIREAEQRKKYEEQERKKVTYEESVQYEPKSNQNNDGSGCCLVALFMMIFLLPFKILGSLTKEYN